MEKREEEIAVQQQAILELLGSTLNSLFPRTKKVLFEERKIENAKEYAKAILKDLKIIGGIPIPINLFEKMFERKERSKDVFSFNFFIRLTKELHLAQVFAITSDSLFIERVYSEAMLQGRCRYLLVDDFDEETTTAFLEGHGFTDDEKAKAWEYCGGKPVYLLELIRADDRVREIERLLRMRAGELKTFLKTLKELGDKISQQGKGIDIGDLRYTQIGVIEWIRKVC